MNAKIQRPREAQSTPAAVPTAAQSTMVPPNRQPTPVQRPRAAAMPEFETAIRHVNAERAAATSTPGSWRWVDLVTSLTMATALAGTWIWKPGREIWDQVDQLLFRFANGALSFAWWRKGWAAMNHDWCDYVAIALFSLVLLYAGLHGRRALRRNAISFIVLALFVVGLRGAALWS